MYKGYKVRKILRSDIIKSKFSEFQNHQRQIDRNEEEIYTLKHQILNLFYKTFEHKHIKKKR